MELLGFSQEAPDQARIADLAHEEVLEIAGWVLDVELEGLSVPPPNQVAAMLHSGPRFTYLLMNDGYHAMVLGEARHFLLQCLTRAT